MTQKVIKVLTILLVMTVTCVAAPPAVNDAAKDSTAMVVTKLSDKMLSRGSSAYIGGGYFITNDHVVRGFVSVSIEVPGTKIKSDVEVVYMNKNADVAILKAPEHIKGLKPVVWAHSDVVEGKTYAAGYGSSMHDDLPGEFLRVYGGGLPNFDLKNKKWYSFDGDEGCSISGDSGGPAFNDKGEYLGPIWGTDKTNTYAIRNSLMWMIVDTL